MNLIKMWRHIHKTLLFIKILLFVCLLTTTLHAKEGVTVAIEPLSELLRHKIESAPAKIVNINHALLAAEVSGRVIKIHIEKGDIVEKNQILLEIDCKDYTNQRQQAKAALDAAKAQYELAKKQYLRNQSLSQNNTISQNNVDISFAQRNQALADVALKKALLSASNLTIDKCLIKAPFQGQITERLSSLGDFLTPGKPVLRLLQTQASKVEAQLTPIKSQSIKQARNIYFIAKNIKSSLKLDTMVNIIDPQTNSLTVRFSQKPATDKLIIGLSGRVQWQSHEGYLPAKYLIKRNGKLGVMITKDKQSASFHPINHAIEGQSTTTELPGETLLIISNLLTLQDADSIIVE
ncbi:MAG: Unknown protein [uncultured Thiotrichaceae bacterium]|uniref:Multidrug resistance protein MdtA-like barrel-sandwich hybrid domain-containing protein n=1 Tax=uncultured Thiotrichaceae bacterium TaxID=298394 RepID=A0A6S6TNS6_9GAMM|nr:MAG: Unknown protein [uncultured Thiotrichaceae bacterium]